MFKEMPISERLVFLGRLFQSLGGSMEGVGKVLQTRNLRDETDIETNEDENREDFTCDDSEKGY